jgi:hypothetical protein
LMNKSNFPAATPIFFSALYSLLYRDLLADFSKHL